MFFKLRDEFEMIKKDVSDMKKALKVLSERTLALKKGGCAYGGYEYSRDIGACFKLYTTLKTWFQANDTCTEDGASLLILYNQSYYDKIKRLLPSGQISTPDDCRGKGDIWLGATDIELEGTFKWVNKERFTTWQKSVIRADDKSCDNEQIADCVVVHLGKDHWKDRDCERFKNPFVCIRSL